MLSNWILEQNLRPFVELLAHLAGDATVDDLDVDAITWGMGESDADHDRWYAYPFRGEHAALRLELAREPSAIILNVRVQGAEGEELLADLERAVFLLVVVCQDYGVEPMHCGNRHHEHCTYATRWRG
jgi:hypothetical protein